MKLAVALTAVLAAAYQPAGFVHEVEDRLADFRYAWPAEVEREPALRALLTEEMNIALGQTRRAAIAERASFRNFRDFDQHRYDADWDVAGATPRLLSLVAETDTSTGDDEEQPGFSAILWDRETARRVEPAELLGQSAIARLEPRYCRELDTLREEQRDGPVERDPADPFTACPRLADQLLAFADDDGDGRFEMLLVLFEPYQVGPPSEGTYTVELDLDSDDLVAIPEAIASAFEAVAEAGTEAEDPEGENDDADDDEPAS
jgi:hypothetical protein